MMLGAFILPSAGVVLLCIFSSIVQGISTDGCNIPPEFWCSSQQVARKCQVEEQCAKSVWLPSAVLSSAADKVQLGFYYETMCPDCQNFVAEQLFPTYSKLSDIIDLQLIPYGNAREKQVGDQWEFTCQHGPRECEGNLMQTCAIYIVKNMTAVFPFVACMEMSEQIPHDSGPVCAKKCGIDFAAVSNCMSSPLGNKLEHEMALQTDKLDPPHNFVPWITLNGVHTDDIQEQAQQDLKKLICDTYKGTKPDICKTVRKKSSCRRI